MPVHRYMEERLAGVTPDVNLGESVTCIPLPSMNKAVYYGFETQERCHQKSKPLVSVAPQKGLISTKNLKLKTLLQSVFKFICNHLVLCDPLRFTPPLPIFWQKLQKIPVIWEGWRKRQKNFISTFQLCATFNSALCF